MLGKYQEFVIKTSNWFGNIATVMLLVIAFITFLDIFGSKFFTLPVPGSVELTGFLQSILIPFAAALTLICGQHIKVDLFTDWLPKNFKTMLDGIISLLLFFLSVVLVWQSIVLGESLQSVGEYSGTLHIPIFYVVYTMAVGFVSLALAFLGGFLKLFNGDNNESN